MRIREDIGGVESFPLRLMIVAAVVALSIAPAANCLKSFKEKEFIQRAEEELDDIVSTAEMIAMEGPGNVRTLSIDLRDGGAAGFSKIVLGDREDGPNISSAIIELGNDRKLIRSATGPAVWMRSLSYDAVVIMSESFDLRLSSVLDKGVISVVVEEVGWTS